MKESKPPQRPSDTSGATGETFTIGHHEAIEVEGNKVDFVDATEEIIEPSPNGSYPGGSGVVVGLRINGDDFELSKLSDGYASMNALWLGEHRYELVSYTSRTKSIELRVARVSDQIVGPTRSVRVGRGNDVSLSGGAAMTFESHGHKRVYENQGSPLVVRVSYWRVAKVGEDLESRDPLGKESHNLGPPATGQSWRWRDYHFTLGDYEYNQFMVLDVQRLALKAPLSP